MKVEIVLRQPGNHHVIWNGELPDVPRVGELVAICGDNGFEQSHNVHSIDWLIYTDGTAPIARVKVGP